MHRAEGLGLYWPAGVSDCRPSGQSKFSRAARSEQLWFLHALLVHELQQDHAATSADLERVLVTPEMLKKAVDSELDAEDFPDTLQLVVDAISASTSTQRSWTTNVQDTYRGALLEVSAAITIVGVVRLRMFGAIANDMSRGTNDWAQILGFCDEDTADKVLGLLKESSTTVRDLADSLGCLLEHEGNATGELCRKLQALLWLQKASAGNLIAGLGSMGSSIAELIHCGLAHTDAECRVRASDVILQAGLHCRERESSDAAASLLCRSALYDFTNRPFLLSAAWDLLLVQPASSFAPIVTSRNRDSFVEVNGDQERTTVLAFLLGFLRFGQEDSSELDAACITALGAAKMILHHPDMNSAEVIRCRLNGALVQCRRLEDIRSKNSKRQSRGSGNTSKAPRAGRHKGANPLRIILEDVERRFKLQFDQLGPMEVKP